MPFRPFISLFWMIYEAVYWVIRLPYTIFAGTGGGDNVANDDDVTVDEDVDEDDGNDCSTLRERLSESRPARGIPELPKASKSISLFKTSDHARSIGAELDAGHSVGVPDQRVFQLSGLGVPGSYHAIPGRGE